MKYVALISFLSLLAFSQIDGRWDLTVTTPQSTYPSWIEVTGDQVRVVGREASVHSAQNVKRNGSSLSFHTSEWLGAEMGVDWDFTLQGGTLTGKQKRADGIVGQIQAARAPALKGQPPAAWSKPESLFNGKDLTGWVPSEPAKGPAPNHYVAQNGELVNEAAGANIRTTRKFQDFKLHVEFNCPQDGNSGVYLRGRYEVQVEYEPADKNDKLHGMGSIYGFLGPAVSMRARPGQWESFDITLVGRMVTVVRDGTTVIDNQEIPGITGGALDSHEGQPGPLYIQGDHTGGMKYRNITISEPAR